MAARDDRRNRPGVTDAVAGGDEKVNENRFRKKRFRLFRRLLTDNFAGRDVIRVADIGGAQRYWQALRPLWQDLPLEITIINIGAEEFDDPPYHVRDGDACDLSGYADNSFDVVHSNSVIEHVGHWPEMSAMAKEISRLAPHYYVQTPNFGFPFEPHFRSLFFHWYPEAMRAHMVMKRRRGFIEREETMEGAMLQVQAVNLLDARQMAALFPDGRIRRERFLGFAKSLIAIR